MQDSHFFWNRCGPQNPANTNPGVAVARRIFVQIPAYRDRELLPTLQALFEAAVPPPIVASSERSVGLQLLRFFARSPVDRRRSGQDFLATVRNPRKKAADLPLALGATRTSEEPAKHGMVAD